MNNRWMKRLAVVLTLVLVAETAFAAPGDGPRSLKRIEAGRAVRVTMKTQPGFDAIWIGRADDRAIFERLDSHETIGIQLDELLEVQVLAQGSGKAQLWGALGAAAGFFGGLLALGAFLIPRT
jgi:hypothetical protein